MRLAQEHNEPRQQQKNPVGGGGRQQQQQQGGQINPRNTNNSYAYRSSDPTVLYPTPAHCHQNHTSQNQQESSPTGISNTYLSAENEQQYLLPQEKQQYHNQHKQSDGSLGTSSYDHMNYMPPPQDQNVIPSGSLTENHMKVSCLHSSTCNIGKKHGSIFCYSFQQNLMHN